MMRKCLLTLLCFLACCCFVGCNNASNENKAPKSVPTTSTGNSDTPDIDDSSQSTNDSSGSLPLPEQGWTEVRK